MAGTIIVQYLEIVNPVKNISIAIDYTVELQERILA